MARTILLTLLVLDVAMTSASAADGPTRPNLILMIADDMGRDDCGAYGQTRVKTPNIDALARGGMRFDRAFIMASSCSPSRSSMITGRYPHNTDAEELHWPLPAEQVTFVEKLKADGYYTAAAGKWHLGDAVRGRFDLVREADPSGYMLAPAVKGAERLVPPLSSTSEDLLRKFTHTRKFELASQDANPRSPGATKSTVRPDSLKPPELREEILSLSQPVVAKYRAAP